MCISGNGLHSTAVQTGPVVSHFAHQDPDVRIPAEPRSLQALSSSSQGPLVLAGRQTLVLYSSQGTLVLEDRQKADAPGSEQVVLTL